MNMATKSKETLKSQQQRLDLEKWNRSIATSCDQSGSMYYCDGCPSRVSDYHCSATQDQRVSGNLCARNARKIKEAKDGK